MKQGRFYFLCCCSRLFALIVNDDDVVCLSEETVSFKKARFEDRRLLSKSKLAKRYLQQIDITSIVVIILLLIVNSLCSCIPIHMHLSTHAPYTCTYLYTCNSIHTYVPVLM